MEAGASQEAAKLTQLADFWLFEHLLVMPSSIATDEIISHLGAQFPHRDTENGSLPAPVSARLFLRHLRNAPQVTDWEELLQLLGLFCMLSCKRHQFRSRQAAAAVNPTPELLTEVLMQALCSRADPASSSQGSQQQQQPLTARAVLAEAESLMEEADVTHIKDDEILQNRLSLLKQLLQSRLAPEQLHLQLLQAFPADDVREQLREYVDKAWHALGPTTLQLHQKSVLSNSQLPFDPMQHFAALLPVATQQALDAAAAAAAGASPAAKQPQQPARAPVPLLGEATAPVLGTEEPAVVPRSSERTGRGRQQRERPAAAPAQPKASPSAAAAAAGDAGAAEPARKSRDPRLQKLGKEVKQDAAAGARPSRKQLQLEPTTAAAAAAAAAAGAEEAQGADAAAAADGGKKGRRSKQQQQPETEEGSGPAAAAAAAAATGDVDMPPPAAAGSGGRKRGRKPSSPAAAVPAAGSQPASSGKQRSAGDGEQQPAAAAAAGGQDSAVAGKAGSGSLASAFLQVLNRPLDGLAAAAGGLAAAVRGSPSVAARKDRKLCGAGQEGVKGRTVPWESPFGGSSSSPEGTPKAKSAKSPAGAAAQAAAAAAAAGPAVRPVANALKRKRAQAEGLKGPVAAAKAAGAAAPDSGNTVYQDAREEAGPEEQSAEPRRRSPRQHKRRRFADDDSSIDEPDSDDGYSPGSDSDFESDGGGRRLLQHRKRHNDPGQRKPPAAAAGPSGGRGRAGGAAAAAAAAGGSTRRAAEAEDVDDKRRRKHTRWSPEEEQLLIQLVAQEGEGQWARILKLGDDGFHRRTQVDLKDKWRNLKKKGAL